MAEAPRTMRYEAVDGLRPHPRNPKNHSIDELRKSLGRWGYTMPVMVCERTGLLAAGHGRRALVLADQEVGADPPEGVVVDDEGRWTIPVVHGWSSKNDAELLAYVIADNQQTIAAGWNPALLVSGLQEITTAGADLDGVGISSDDLDDLIASLGPVPSVDELKQREGESEPSDFWPALTVKLSPALAERWQAAKARAESDDDVVVLAWVLEQVAVPA